MKIKEWQADLQKKAEEAAIETKSEPIVDVKNVETISDPIVDPIEAKAFELDANGQKNLLQLYFSLEKVLVDAGIIEKKDESDDVTDNIPQEIWDELVPNIDAFNDAAENGDADALEESANKILDTIEKVRPNANDEVKKALDTILDALQEVFDEEDTAQTDTEETTPSPAEKSEPAVETKDEMVSVDLTQFKRYL
jgi:hypothetical protein